MAVSVVPPFCCACVWLLGCPFDDQGPGVREHVKPVGFIFGKVAELCISDFDDIDLHHAC